MNEPRIEEDGEKEEEEESPIISRFIYFGGKQQHMISVCTARKRRDVVWIRLAEEFRNGVYGTANSIQAIQWHRKFHSMRKPTRLAHLSRSCAHLAAFDRFAEVLCLLGRVDRISSTILIIFRSSISRLFDFARPGSLLTR